MNNLIIQFFLINRFNCHNSYTCPLYVNNIYESEYEVSYQRHISFQSLFFHRKVYDLQVHSQLQESYHTYENHRYKFEINIGRLYSSIAYLRIVLYSQIVFRLSSRPRLRDYVLSHKSQELDISSLRSVQCQH